jgi:hypothetical protein
VFKWLQNTQIDLGVLMNFSLRTLAKIRTEGFFYLLQLILPIGQYLSQGFIMNREHSAEEAWVVEFDLLKCIFEIGF